MINIDLPVTDRMLRKMSQMRKYDEIERIISEAKEAVDNPDRTIQDSCIKEVQQRVIAMEKENIKSVCIGLIDPVFMPLPLAITGIKSPITVLKDLFRKSNVMCKKEREKYKLYLEFIIKYLKLIGELLTEEESQRMEYLKNLYQVLVILQENIVYVVKEQ